MRYSVLSIATLLLVVASSFSASAKFPGILQRYEIFFSYTKAFADYSRTDKISINGPTQTLSVGERLQSDFSYGGGMGTFWNLTSARNPARLTLDLGVQTNLYTFKLPVNGYTILPDNSFAYNREVLFPAVVMQLGMPIGLSTRWGCDAKQDKGFNYCYSLGAGVLPSYSLSTDLETLESQVGVQPYLKAEVGFFKGICMKLRVQYSFTRVTLLDGESKTKFETNDFSTNTNLTNTSTLAVSLVFMPFSFTWGRDAWWNTY